MTPKRRALLTLLKLTDLVVVALCFVVAVAAALTEVPSFRPADVLKIRIDILNALFVLVYLGLWHFVLSEIGLYNSYRLATASREWRDLSLSALVSVGLLIPMAAIFRFEYVTLFFVSTFGALSVLALGTERRLLRALARALHLAGKNLRDVVIVGDGDNALRMSAELMKRQELGYRVVQIIEVDNDSMISHNGNTQDKILAELRSLIDAGPVDEVFVTLAIGNGYRLVQAFVSLCEEQGVIVRVIARVADLEWAHAAIDEINGAPVLTISSGPPDTLSLLAKRGIDIAAALVGLLALTPLFLVAAIAIKLDSRGSVLFVQDRVGYNRRRFRAFKFRTMVDGAEKLQAALEPLNEAQGPIFKIREDPRVTRVGAWLRHTSIDELPQLINVLFGQMSLVGPRPLPIRDVDRIDARAHKRRFSVKPGITGLWQANGREPDFDEWVKADMQYIDHWSLGLDLKILLKTIPAVLSGKEAH